MLLLLLLIVMIILSIINIIMIITLLLLLLLLLLQHGVLDGVDREHGQDLGGRELSVPDRGHVPAGGDIYIYIYIHV